MKTFTTLNKVSKISNPKTGESVNISKVLKEGTKRTFFKVERDGKLVFTTMFARLGDAERNAKLFLNRNN
jgi:hypothetical protein